MVTPLHEGLISIATLDTARTGHMLRSLFNLPLPQGSAARVISPDLSECVPASYHADAALLYGEQEKLGVITEVQLKRDPAKRWTWPVYLSTMRARDRCKATLVVICPDRSTAVWAAEPIDTGHPGFVLRPLVIGPDNTPVITDVARAVGDIGLAAISAITHNDHPEIHTILATLSKALDDIDPKLAHRYAEYVTVALTGSAQKEMERLMATETYLYQGEYAQSLLKRGRAEEGAKMVLLVLEARGIPVPEQARERISACTDVPTLQTWIKRAALIDTLDDLFA
ncbi:hypothetical protein [Nonomuraea sp. SBT364]|uniref:hypothetical protein n=1 Tax=Nonomuraea sp. SBT364 TaxID=1580530 RepID=UPI00066B9519|nr:hypothetical protein [Nonomuraea sp. SBT364]